MGAFHPLKNIQKAARKNLVGDTLRRIRATRTPSVSLDDLAGRLAALGVTMDRSAIGRVENGKRYLLDFELIALARALRVKVRDITGIE